MCTKNGDLYDHVKDWVVNTIYFAVIFKKYKKKLSPCCWALAVLFFLFLLSLQVVYFAAQERYYNKLDNIPSLLWAAHIIKTKEQAIKTLKIVRWFGCGTFIVSVCIFVLFLHYK